MHRDRGQSLVELLVAVAIAMVMLPAVIVGFVATRQGKVQQHERFSATSLAQESQEVVRIIRDRGWNFIAQNGMYHPEIVNNQWTLVAGADTINLFTRSITIGDVYRNTNGDIVTTGGVVDPSTKKITIDISWNVFIPSSVTLTSYMTRHAYDTYTETTKAEFDAGTLTDTITTNTNGGEVTLGAGGKADWCEPVLTIAALDLPKSGVANAVSAIEGKVFAGTGENASGVSYATVTIQNTDPPIATLSGTYNGYKTNDIFGETNYAYIATDNNAKEIEIVDLTTTPYSEAGYFNAPGNGNGDGVYVVGSVGYMTSADKFYTFDLTSKSGSRTQLGTVTLAGTGVKIFVVGSYAYVVINSATTQLQIVDISSAASPTVVGQAQLSAGVGIDIYVNNLGTRAYLATAASVSQPEFFILDVSTKTGNHNTPIGSFDTAGMNPKGVTLVPSSKAIVVGTGGTQQYQVIDISTESAPVKCTSNGRSGGLAVATGVNGISSVLEADGDAFSYIITGDATTELKIIEGGPGGKFATTGSFTSQPFISTSAATFNRLSYTSTLPDQTTLRFQVASAAMVNNSCASANYVYVGPDGTTNTYFSTAGTIPYSGPSGYANPGQCFQYKAYLDTNDLFQGPILQDVTINYSP